MTSKQNAFIYVELWFVLFLKMQGYKYSVKD